LHYFYAINKQLELAINNFEKAVNLGHVSKAWAEEEGLLDEIRTLPKFKKLIAVLR